jgi:hypothetical protein
MKRYSLLFAFLLGLSFSGFAQHSPMDTLGITNGSVHMKGTFPYTQFLKKYKGDNSLVLHIWYNPSGSSLSKKEITADKDELYFLYGRNLRSGLTEMDYKLGSNAKNAFSKKKQKELIKLIELFEFEVFQNQTFNSFMAYEALVKALE